MFTSKRKSAPFHSDNRGNVAMIFALTSVMTVGIVGGAVDFGRVYAKKTELQAALDAATLAGGAEYARTGDLVAAKTMTASYFQQRYTANAGKNADIPTLTFVSSNALISTEATVTVPTPFMSLVAGDSVQVTVDSSISNGGKKLELALMFDVTGSMADVTSTGNSKIVDAKAAALDLMDIVMPASGIMQSRMALIPFSQTVKLDADTASTITGQPTSKQVPITVYVNQTTYSLNTSNTTYRTLSNCTSYLSSNYYQNLGQSSSTADANADAYCRTLPTKVKSNQTQYATPAVSSSTQSVPTTQNQTQYIKPCFIERASSSSSTKYGESAPATGQWTASYSTTKTADVSCPPTGTNGAGTLVPLTNSRSTFTSAVNALKESGSTAGHIGTAWAWYAISPLWKSIWGSSSEPTDYGDLTVMKAAVLMTDGDYNSCGGTTASCSTSSTQALQFCTNMKAAGITVYTIGFGMSTTVTDPARQTLMNCASPGKYYFPYNGTEIRAAFQDIGQAIVAGGVGPRILAENEVLKVSN